MVDEIHNQIAIHLLDINEKDGLDVQKNLASMIMVLDFFYKSNERVHRLLKGHFQNGTFSDRLDMKYIAKQYYYRRKANSSKAVAPMDEDFVFLDYPWLFTTEAKVDIIQHESRFTMGEEVANMMEEEMDINFLNPAQLNLNIQVRRNKLLDDSLKMLSTQSKNFKKQLKVKFVGEEGVDQGGVKKEFFHLLVKELFNPMYAMFEQKFNVG